MIPPRTARLVGSDGSLRARVVATLLEAGWDVRATATMRDRLDLGVFIPSIGTPGSLSALAPADWWSRVGGDLTSAFRCAKGLVPQLAGSSGALVFVSSLLGEIGAPNRTAFSAATAGIVGLMKALTVDVPGVRFSAVAPALPFPEQPWSSPDVDWHVGSTRFDEASIARATADAVLFLADDREGHHRGQVIRIPSGITT